MRVLHLVKTPVGASWAHLQMRELVRLGLDVHVAVPDGPMVARYRDVGCNVHVAEPYVSASSRRTARALVSLRRLVAAVEPDVIHSHFVNTTVAMRLALGPTHPVPRLFQVPGPLHLENPVTRAAEIALAGGPDRWIGSCRWTCERYRRSGVPAERVFESVYGIEVERYRPTRPPGVLRAELSISTQTRVVGMVAYMYAPKWYLGQRVGVKGHEDLIDAIARVRARGLDVIGVFVGGAWDNAVDYERQVRARGAARLGDAARFLGTRRDVADLLQDIDVVVHPPHSENLGGVAEGMLMGRPTIATWVGGLPDLVRDGETGWLVPPHSPGALADAIAEVLLSPEEARRRATLGRERTSRIVDVRRTAIEVRDIYQRVLAGNG